MSTTQRVRQKSGPRGARLNVRLNQRAKETIEQAAVASHQTVTDFVVTSLLRASNEVLKQHQTIRLTTRDRDQFLAALDSRDRPNRALGRASKEFKRKFK